MNPNPYNCTKPGNLFVGYERLRQEIMNGFRNGNSFAVIGGRRCGKTSLLIQLEKDIEKENVSPFHSIPQRFSIQELSATTPEVLFEKMYNLTVKDIQAGRWELCEIGKEYQSFLEHLDKAASPLDVRYGSDWLVIFLIDELDSALINLQDDLFFQNLRHFLMESRFHRHFRIVASGVNDLMQLIHSGSSPLNNLRYKYLSILTSKQATELVKIGFPEEKYDPETLLVLFEMTGRHPFLMQGVLEKLWITNDNWNKQIVKRAAHDFMREHRDFQNWIKAFGPVEHAVYQCLVQAAPYSVAISTLKQKVNISFRDKIDDALTVLSSCGVIDDYDLDEPKIAGTLFRDWYQSKNFNNTLGEVE